MPFHFASTRRALPALLIFLAGCSLFQSEKAAPPCPRASLIDGADRVVRYAGEGRASQDVAFTASILSVAGDCEFSDDQRRVTMNMKVRIAGSRGPALVGKEAPLSYFVAIIAPDGKILVRDEFDTAIPLTDDRAIIAEELQPVIPLAEGRRAASYTVFVGLVITEEELEANRKR